MSDDTIGTKASWLHRLQADSLSDTAKVNKIKDLLDSHGIPLEAIGSVEKIKVWQGFVKNADGEAELTEPMTSLLIDPAWKEGPAWPVVQPAAPIRVDRRRTKGHRLGGDWRTACVVGDPQIGFWRTPDGGLDPIHDERAIAVTLAMIRYIQPDLVVVIGDTLDFPEISRWKKTPEFAQTVQPTVDRTAMLWAQLRTAAPDARIVALAGNHDARLPNWIRENAGWAFGLKRAEAAEAEWPVMTVPFLTCMDRYGIEYVDGYPAGALWVANDRLRFIHGTVVGKRDSGKKVLTSSSVSTVQGHTHRVEVVMETRDVGGRPQRLRYLNPGTVARIDGAVPSYGSNRTQAPTAGSMTITHHEDWQQGMGVVHYKDDGTHRLVPVEIVDGAAVYADREFFTVDADEVAA